MKKWKLLFVLSSVCCLLTISALVYVSARTSFFQRVFAKLGWVQRDPSDKPDYWCIRGWNNTLDKLDLDVDVVFYGNSITCGSSFQDYFPEVSICNLGYPGDNLDGLTSRSYMIATVKPEKVFVMGGINGLKEMPIKAFIQKYEKLILEIRKNVPSAQLYFQSILPITNEKYSGNDKIQRCNDIIDSLARVYKCQYIDLFSLYEKNGEMNPEYTKDGVHLKPEHYDKWAEAIRPFIESKEYVQASIPSE